MNADPTPTTPERARFEAWAKTAKLNLTLHIPSNEYCFLFTQSAWLAWQAALTQPAPAKTERVSQQLIADAKSSAYACAMEINNMAREHEDILLDETLEEIILRHYPEGPQISIVSPQAVTEGTPTPETDNSAFLVKAGQVVSPVHNWPVVHADFARRLETQRNEARQQLAEAKAEVERWAKLTEAANNRYDALMAESQPEIVALRTQHTQLLAKAEELKGALQSIADEAGQHHEHNLVSGKNRLPVGYTRILNLAADALERYRTAFPAAAPSAASGEEDSKELLDWLEAHCHKFRDETEDSVAHAEVTVCMGIGQPLPLPHSLRACIRHARKEGK